MRNSELNIHRSSREKDACVRVRLLLSMCLEAASTVPLVDINVRGEEARRGRRRGKGKKEEERREGRRGEREGRKEEGKEGREKRKERGKEDRKKEFRTEE